MPTFEKTGSLPLDPSIDSADLPSHLAECLQGVRARDVQVQGNRVTFTGGAFRFVTSLNPLYYFGSGDLTVDSFRHVISYRLNYLWSVYFSVLAFLFAATVLVKAQSLAWVVLVVPFLCGALVLVGVRIGLLRFEGFLRRSLTSAVHTSPTRGSSSDV